MTLDQAEGVLYILGGLKSKTDLNDLIAYDLTSCTASTWPRHPVYRTGQETGILKFGPKNKQETGQVFFEPIFQTGNRTGL